jgi:hypothetical protein
MATVVLFPNGNMPFPDGNKWRAQLMLARGILGSVASETTSTGRIQKDAMFFVDHLVLMRYA